MGQGTPYAFVTATILSQPSVPLQVIHAGVNLLDKVDELKKRSEDTKREMALRQRQEEEQKRRLEDLEANNMEFDKKYSSLEVRDAVLAVLRCPVCVFLCV